jgi:hypothetical protein
MHCFRFHFARLLTRSGAFETNAQVLFAFLPSTQQFNNYLQRPREIANTKRFPAICRVRISGFWQLGSLRPGRLTDHGKTVGDNSPDPSDQQWACLFVLIVQLMVGHHYPGIVSSRGPYLMLGVLSCLPRSVMVCMSCPYWDWNVTTSIPHQAARTTTSALCLENVPANPLLSEVSQLSLLCSQKPSVWRNAKRPLRSQPRARKPR